MEQFFAACHGREPIKFDLRPNGGGVPLTVEFDKPFILLGRDEGVDLGMDNPATAPRQLYMQLIDGRLFAIQLSESVKTMVGDRQWKQNWVEHTDVFQVGEAMIQCLNPQHPLPPGIDPPFLSPLSVQPGAANLYRLELQTNDNVLRSIRVSRRILLIGRSNPSRVRVRHPSLSGVHAAIVHTPTGIWVVDLASTTGLFVNGEQLQVARIEIGGQFTLGEVNFRIASPEINLSERPRALEPKAKPSIKLPVSQSSTAKPSVPSKPVANSPQVSAILEQVASHQRQTLEQFRQMLSMVTQMFGTVIQEQRAFVKDELDRMERIMRSNSAAQPMIPPLHVPAGQLPMMPQIPNGLPQPGMHPGMHPHGMQPMGLPQPMMPGMMQGALPTMQPQVSLPPVGQAAPTTNELQMHTWLNQQFTTLEQEHATVWKRIMQKLRNPTG